MGKISSKTRQAHTTDTTLPAHTSKSKNIRQKSMKTHWKPHFSNVTFPAIQDYGNFANFEELLFYTQVIVLEAILY